MMMVFMWWSFTGVIASHQFGISGMNVDLTLLGVRAADNIHRHPLDCQCHYFSLNHFIHPKMVISGLFESQVNCSACINKYEVLVGGLNLAENTQMWVILESNCSCCLLVWLQALCWLWWPQLKIKGRPYITLEMGLMEISLMLSRPSSLAGLLVKVIVCQLRNDYFWTDHCARKKIASTPQNYQTEFSLNHGSASQSYNFLVRLLCCVSGHKVMSQKMIKFPFCSICFQFPTNHISSNAED